MRHVMICCVAGLAILWAGNVGLAKDRTERREQRKITREDKQEHQKPMAMTPQQRKAIAVRVRKAIDKDLASLRRMRETAVGEKATGTVAEIDKAIAAKEKQSKRLTSLGQKWKAGRKGEAAKGDQSQSKSKAGHRKHRKSERS
jgi:hypothetical protein